MPPRRRKTAEQVDVEDPSYDGVPTVRVIVDAESAPEPDPAADVELAVAEVVVDDTTTDTTADDDEQE